MVNKLKSRIPYLGNNQALKNHIANALRNAGDLNVVIKNIDAIPKENMDSLTKTGLEKFKNEIIPEIRQIIKETQGETAKQGTKLEQAGAKQEAVKGKGWTMRDGGEANLEIYEGNGVIDFSSKIDDDFLRANATKLEPSSNLFDFLAKTKNNPSRDKILNHFADKAGERDSKALDHRMAYLNYIMPTIEEPLIKIFRPDGRISNIKPFVFTDVNSKTKNVNFLSIVTDKDGNIDFITAYALKDKSQLRSEIKKGIKVEVRRGLTRTFDPHSRVQVPSATDEIISQKGNLVNEKEANGLRDSVSSVGDNASQTGGTLNAKDENGNFDAEKFAKGFIYGLFGSKVTAATLKKTNPKLYDQIVKIAEGNASKEKISSFVNKLKQDELGKLLQKTVTNKDLSTKTKVEIIEAAKKRFAKETPKSLNGQSEAQMIVKDKDQKEKRGIYNVAYNDKKSTIIYKDLEAIENAIKFEKGFENKVTKKGFGALHIEKHLNEKNAGWVTQQEYLNMGEVVRKGKLNTDKYGRRSYEYYKNGIRFRVAIGYTGKGKDRVISFFSDRKPKK